MMEWAPLNDEELAELKELNQEDVDNVGVIAGYFAIASIIPLLFTNYADLFPPPVIYLVFTENLSNHY